MSVSRRVEKGMDMMRLIVGIPIGLACRVYGLGVLTGRPIVFRLLHYEGRVGFGDQQFGAQGFLTSPCQQRSLKIKPIDAWVWCFRGCRLMGLECNQ